jgi:hypothetical protein
MFFHVLFRDVFTVQLVVASLQSRDMIPDDTSDVYLVMQADIVFGCIEAILIGFANFEYTWHGSDTLFVGESVGVAAPRLTSQLN